MIEEIAERKPKKDVCHFAIVLKVIFQKWFPLVGAESHEKKKQAQPQEDVRRKESLRERIIKNKKPLNPTHIYVRKEKHLEIKTTKKVVLMSQFDDDEEGETLQKRQRR